MSSFLPIELLLLLIYYLVISRLLTKSSSLGFLWLTQLIYFVPPLTEQIVHLEQNPEALKKWLKLQGRTTHIKGKSKDEIELITARLDGEFVVASEGRYTKQDLETHRKAAAVTGITLPHNFNEDVIQHKPVSADMSSNWKSFVDLVAASLLAVITTHALSYSSLIFGFDTSYFDPTMRGMVSITAILVTIPIYLLLKALWRRAPDSFDWRSSFFVAFGFAVLIFVILSQTPSKNSTTNSERVFWDIPISQGWNTTILSLQEAAARFGLLNDVKTQDQKQTKHTLTDQQQDLRKLFAGNPTGTQENLSSGFNTNDAILLGFKMIATFITIPLGLVLLISTNRQVKAMFQAKSNPKIPGLFKSMGYVNVIVMPALITVLWNTSMPEFLYSYGLIESVERIVSMRRGVGVLFAVQQLLMVRAFAQSQLDMGESITRVILSADKKAVGKGLMIQQGIRSIVKGIYVVAIELTALPTFHIGLLLMGHWFTDAIYLATIIIIWPTSLLLMLIPGQAYKTAV